MVQQCKDPVTTMSSLTFADSSSGLADDHTITKVDGKFIFRRKIMDDYSEEMGPNVEWKEVTNADGSVSQQMTQSETVKTDSKTGERIAEDSTRWKGKAVQEACRRAVIDMGGSSMISKLLFRKFWPDQGDFDAYTEELDADVAKHAESEATLRNLICKETSTGIVFLPVDTWADMLPTRLSNYLVTI